MVVKKIVMKKFMKTLYVSDPYMFTKIFVLYSLAFSSGTGTVFCVCFFTSRIWIASSLRIRIQEVSNIADPDPKHCSVIYRCFMIPRKVFEVV